MTARGGRQGPRQGSGALFWLVQRLTALALVPLSLWLLGALIVHAGDGAQALAAWMSRPLPAAGMAVLLLFLFVHLAQGLQVMIEDYVGAGKAASLAIGALRVLCLGGAITGLGALALLAAGSQA